MKNALLFFLAQLLFKGCPTPESAGNSDRRFIHIMQIIILGTDISISSHFSKNAL